MDTPVSPPAAPPTIPELIQRYLDGTPIKDLAADARVSRATIYNWIHREAADPTLVQHVLITRFADAEQRLEDAEDMLDLARARELNNNAKWQLERRVKMFSPKQEINADMQVTVVIEAPPHIDKPASIIDVSSQVIDNTEGKS